LFFSAGGCVARCPDGGGYDGLAEPETIMIMRFKATLLLAFSLRWFGPVSVPHRISKRAKKEAAEEKASRVFSFSSKEVSGLIVRYLNTDEISLAKGGDGKWRMARPMETPASRTLINKIIGMTGGLEFKRVAEEKPADLRSSDWTLPGS